MDKLSESVRKSYVAKQEQEWNGFRIFRNTMLDPQNGIQRLFMEQGVVFNIEYLSAKQFISMFDKTEDQITYLKRYTLD